MVNLTIRLNVKGAGGETSTPTKTAVEGPGTPKLVCGGHLIQAELPAASGLGLISDLASASTPSSGYLGYKVRRTAGDKVHFCVRCHFPIAIYGRLDPCEHVFCLICAKEDLNCYLCDERILRIQRLEVLEGIFVCGAAGCLRSFLSKHEFEWHIREVHSHLLSSREAPPSKLQNTEAPQPSHSLGPNHTAPTPSPSQSQPHSPSHSRQLEPPAFGSNSNLALPEPLQVPEKIVKQLSNSSGPSGDLSEPPSKRKKLELQLNAVAREREKEKEREREKGRERDDHAKGHDDRDREDGPRVREREHPQKEREHSHRKRDRGNQERERDREKDRNRDQERDFQNQMQRDRDQWEQQQHVHPQHQGPGLHYQLPPPPLPLPPPPTLQPNAPERMVQVPLAQQGGAPGSYPPQGFPPYHVQQQQENRNTSRFESPRHGPFMDPRMTVPPDYQETNTRPRHPQQEGERARNIPPPQQQEGYRQAIMVPHFHGDYGGPMGMPMGPPAMQGMVRFQEGAHGGGHVPTPKRGNFGPSGETAMAHPPHAFGWGGPANFAGAPVHPPFMNWQPPQ